MNNPNFGAILDRPASSVERPKALPVGTYVCVVKGLPRFDKAKTGTELVEFTLQPLQARDDVDVEALTEIGGYTEKTLRATYYLTEDSLYRLRDFLTDLGFDEDDDKSLREMISEAPGCQVLVTVMHTPSKDGKMIYANVGTTARVEE